MQVLSESGPAIEDRRVSDSSSVDVSLKTVALNSNPRVLVVRPGPIAGVMETSVPFFAPPNVGGGWSDRIKRSVQSAVVLTGLTS